MLALSASSDLFASFSWLAIIFKYVQEDCFYDLPYNTGYQIFVLRLRKTRDEIMKCTLSIYVDIYFVLRTVVALDG